MIKHVIKILILIVLSSSFNFACIKEANELSYNNFASGILTVSEIGLGPNRIAFKLLSYEGELINDAYTTVSFQHVEADENIEDLIQYKTAVYTIISTDDHSHSNESTHHHSENFSLYVVNNIYFSKSGYWEVSFSIESKEFPEIVNGNMFIEVKDSTATPSIGSSPPFTNNPTINTIKDLRKISTLEPINKNLYAFTVEKALAMQKPIVIVFSSPGFCQSKACVPMTQSVNQASKLYDNIIFIHIEPWDLEIARQNGKLESTAQSLAWKIPSEPWVFLIDVNGNIVHKLEGVFSVEELILAIRSL